MPQQELPCEFGKTDLPFQKSCPCDAFFFAFKPQITWISPCVQHTAAFAPNILSLKESATCFLLKKSLFFIQDYKKKKQQGRRIPCLVPSHHLHYPCAQRKLSGGEGFRSKTGFLGHHMPSLQIQTLRLQLLNRPTFARLNFCWSINLL